MIQSRVKCKQPESFLFDLGQTSSLPVDDSVKAPEVHVPHFARRERAEGYTHLAKAGTRTGHVVSHSMAAMLDVVEHVVTTESEL